MHLKVLCTSGKHSSIPTGIITRDAAIAGSGSRSRTQTMSVQHFLLPIVQYDTSGRITRLVYKVYVFIKHQTQLTQVPRAVAQPPPLVCTRTHALLNCPRCHAKTTTYRPVHRTKRHPHKQVESGNMMLLHNCMQY